MKSLFKVTEIDKDNILVFCQLSFIAEFEKYFGKDEWKNK